nr:RNA-directed DNA polymerase, eukaryota, reverse transcriptase zinc-binding domain protein [Tanacetum cinerariifolium]
MLADPAAPNIHPLCWLTRQHQTNTSPFFTAAVPAAPNKHPFINKPETNTLRYEDGGVGGGVSGEGGSDGGLDVVSGSGGSGVGWRVGESGVDDWKRRHLAIKRILVEGEWIDDPLSVKSEFFNHFANQISDPDWTRVPFDGQFPKHLDSVQSSDLESAVSNEEIKKAVWDCGSDKSPGLDGFTFEFFKKFWYIVAFDSVRWDHLDDILGKIDFGDKWRGWICSCLTSSKASILVNDSPTDEFLFHRGLRQGDPLSRFLFILVMKSLHVSFQRLVDRGLFSHILIGKDNLIPISHLFYADDATFIGKWSYSNVNALMMMLQWFFLASGLKVNVHKSCIYGVGVRLADNKELADSYGCLANNLLFAYLEVKVSWRQVMAHKKNGGLGPRSEDLQDQSDREWIDQHMIPSSFSTLRQSKILLIKSDREWIDQHMIPSSFSTLRQSKILPIKVNVFIWRMFLDMLPTRPNLSNIGVNIPCSFCPNYDSWKNDGVYDNNAMVLLKNKLKNHKSLQDTFIEIDLRLDKGTSLPDDLSYHSNAIRELNSIDQQAFMDAAQKAKVT